jgi:predicted nucleotidyltransferase
MSTVQKLYNRGLIKPPAFVGGSTQYETVVGSDSYGVSSSKSDMDIYGFCIPPKEIVFPHLAGEIEGFGRQHQRFKVFQAHHIQDAEARKEYDVSVYNIVSYFQLTMEGNPNMADSLFTPVRCILHATKIGQMVREKRHLFLSKKMWHSYKGYAYQQAHKMESKQCDGLPELMRFEDEYNIPHWITYQQAFDHLTGEDYIPALKDHDWDVLNKYVQLYAETKKKSKRAERVKIDGYDCKFGYHTVRLMNQIEQVLTEHDMDLERNREQLKSIRRAEWTREQIVEYFNTKEKQLEDLYQRSTLRHSPDEDAIKQLLLECLEEYYGSLDGCISQVDKHQYLINDLKELLRKYS